MVMLASLKVKLFKSSLMIWLNRALSVIISSIRLKRNVCDQLKKCLSPSSKLLPKKNASLHHLGVRAKLYREPDELIITVCSL